MGGERGDREDRDERSKPAARVGDREREAGKDQKDAVPSHRGAERTEDRLGARRAQELERKADLLENDGGKGNREEKIEKRKRCGPKQFLASREARESGEKKNDRDAREELEHEADAQEVKRRGGDEKKRKGTGGIESKLATPAPEERGCDEGNERSVRIEGIGPPAPDEPDQGRPVGDRDEDRRRQRDRAEREP